MEDSYFHQSPVSISKTIASSGPFQIELIKYVGTNDYVKLIDISESLVKEYGKAAKLTPNTIQTYFNREGTLPFIARHQNQICLLYTSPSPRDATLSRMPSSA